MSDGAIANYSDAIQRSLNVLTNAGNQAIEEIDRRLEELDDEIRRLKRIRRALIDERSPKSERPVASNAGDETMVAAIVKLLGDRGPMKPKEIGEALSCSAQMIGRIVSRNPEALRSSEQGLVVVWRQP